MAWLWSLLKLALGYFLRVPPAPSAEAMQAKEAGAAIQAAKVNEVALAASQRELSAVINAPTDQAGIVAELEKGKF